MSPSVATSGDTNPSDATAADFVITEEGKDYSFETDEKQNLRYGCFCGVRTEILRVASDISNQWLTGLCTAILNLHNNNKPATES